MRLVLLYALRYERHGSNDVQGLHEMLTRRGTPANYRRVRALQSIVTGFRPWYKTVVCHVKLLSSILEYAGKTKRGSDLFGTQNPLSFTKKFLKGLKVEWLCFVSAVVLDMYCCLQGVENVYTQHRPLLVETLDSLVKGKLKEAQFPFVKDFQLKER